ncbi:MAG: glycosyltransferase family 4 protein [Desulfovibrionaceae bacterium]
MRICFVNTNVPWGGGERWALQHALLAREHGHAVSAVVHPLSELSRRLEGEPGITTQRRPLGQLSFLNPLALSSLAAFFRAQRTDTVVMCLPRDLKAAGLAARLAGVRRIVFRRGIDIPVKNTALNRWLYGSVITRLICNTEATRRSVLAENPGLIPLERTSVVPNGLDMAEFDARPVTPMALGGEGEVVIGCAARLTAQKGLPLLLEAFALLRGRGLPVRLALAGGGELEPALRERAAGLGVAGQVAFLGFVEDIKSFYASIDVLALPSHFEGFGYVLVEAGRCGRPVAAFRVSSNPEVVRDGETGLLAEPGSATDLAEKLSRLASDPALRERLGQAGRANAMRYDTGRVWGEFEAALGE